MTPLRKAGVALLVLLACGAVASARPVVRTAQSGPKNGKESVGDHVKFKFHDAKEPKGPKEIILIPKNVTFHAVKQQGKPEKPEKTVFIKNNTIVEIHKEKIKEDKFKEEPIKDTTTKQDFKVEPPKTEFILNNTIIKVHKEIIKDKFKEEPVKDNTVKPDIEPLKPPQTDFIKNFTWVEHEKPEKEIKIKEVPIVDITEKPDKDAWKDAEKEAKEDQKDREKFEQSRFNRQQFGH